MSLDGQSQWRVGPIPAKKVERNGKIQWMANVTAPITLMDAVVKFWPEGHAGQPCFYLEARLDRSSQATLNGVDKPENLVE